MIYNFTCTWYVFLSQFLGSQLPYYDHLQSPGWLPILLVGQCLIGQFRKHIKSVVIRDTKCSDWDQDSWDNSNYLFLCMYLVCVFVPIVWLTTSAVLDYLVIYFITSCWSCHCTITRYPWMCFLPKFFSLNLVLGWLQQVICSFDMVWWWGTIRR